MFNWLSLASLPLWLPLGPFFPWPAYLCISVWGRGRLTFPHKDALSHLEMSSRFEVSVGFGCCFFVCGHWVEGGLLIQSLSPKFTQFYNKNKYVARVFHCSVPCLLIHCHIKSSFLGVVKQEEADEQRLCRDEWGESIKHNALKWKNLLNFLLWYNALGRVTLFSLLCWICCWKHC